MKIYNLSQFTKNWFIGDFEPSLLKQKDFEMAIHELKKGHKSDGHHHKIATEYNVVLDGIVKVDGYTLTNGSIFVFEPYDKSDVTCITDCQLLVLKVPSVKDDKHYE